MTVNRSPNSLAATSQPSTEFFRHWVWNNQKFRAVKGASRLICPQRNNRPRESSSICGMLVLLLNNFAAYKLPSSTIGPEGLATPPAGSSVTANLSKFRPSASCGT